MDNNLDGHVIFIQTPVDTNNKVTDELKKKNYELKNKLNKHDSYFDDIKTLLKQILVHNQNSLSENMDSTKPQDSTTVVPDIKKFPSLEGEHLQKLVT